MADATAVAVEFDCRSVAQFAGPGDFLFDPPMRTTTVRRWMEKGAL
jgi:hypothetical protein